MKKTQRSFLATAALALGLAFGESTSMEKERDHPENANLKTHDDILSVIHAHLEHPKINFQRVCKKWQKISDDSYRSLNTMLGYQKWSECPTDLSPLNIFISVANVLYKLGRYEEAIKYMMKAKEDEDCNLGYLYCSMAKFYTKMEDHEQADHYIKLAIEDSVETSNNIAIFDQIVKFLTKAGRLEQIEKVREFAIDLLSQDSEEK